MHHFVRQHPIARQIGELRVLADVNGDGAAIVAAKGTATAYAFSIGRDDAGAKAAGTQGSGPVIGADRFRGPRAPTSSGPLSTPASRPTRC